jgi:hypothetical protein
VLPTIALPLVVGAVLTQGRSWAEADAVAPRQAIVPIAIAVIHLLRNAPPPAISPCTGHSAAKPAERTPVGALADAARCRP